MLHFRLTITVEQRKALDHRLKTARMRGDVRLINFILAILAVHQFRSYTQAALVLQLSEAQVEGYVKKFICYGVRGVAFKKSPGRPGKLTKDQKWRLAQMIDDGPQKCGFTGGCWRSPMIQELIRREFNVCYNVFYVAQLLRGLGFTWQKAAFVSAHLNPGDRRRWQQETWPEIVRRARARKAHLLFGDEASFPQWGSLSYTWARVARQPLVPTSGIRKGWKVFGLIDYFSGEFFYQGHTGRFNSETYTAFLTQVLAKTTRHLVLIQDGARYHTSRATREFFALHAARLTVYQLPSYSPDYNPIEKLWKKVKADHTHMQYFPTFESLSLKVESACLHFANAPKEVLALCSLPEELALAA